MICPFAYPYPIYLFGFSDHSIYVWQHFISLFRPTLVRMSLKQREFCSFFRFSLRSLNHNKRYSL